MAIKNQLIDTITSMHFGEPWYGISFNQAFASIDQRIVFQSLQNQHSIAQLISHCSKWRESTIKRLEGQPDELSLTHPINWSSNDDLRNLGWNHLKLESEELARHFIATLEGFSPTKLSSHFHSNDGNTYTFRQLIEGTIQHDVYHLGQVIIIRNLLKTDIRSDVQT